MSRPVSVICDVCGKSKGETNRWWTVGMRGHGVPPAMVIEPGTMPSNIHGFDICGEECLLRFISQKIKEIGGNDGR